MYQRKHQLLKPIDNVLLQKLYQDFHLSHSPYYCFDADWRKSFAYMTVVITYGDSPGWHISVASDTTNGIPSSHASSNAAVTLQELETMNVMAMRAMGMAISRELLLHGMVLEVSPEGLELTVTHAE